MRRLGVISMGAGIVALVASLGIAVPAAAHTADQNAQSMLQVTGLNALQQSRSGHDLHRYMIQRDGAPIWYHLFHSLPEFAELEQSRIQQRPLLMPVQTSN